MTRLQDPADVASATDKSAGVDQFTTVHRNGGWTVEQWIDYLDRNPSATLPSGVGYMLLQRSRELEERLQYERDVWRDKHKMAYRLLQNERECRRQESEMSRHTFFRQTAAVDAAEHRLASLRERVEALRKDNPSKRLVTRGYNMAINAVLALLT